MPGYDYFTSLAPSTICGTSGCPKPQKAVTKTNSSCDAASYSDCRGSVLLSAGAFSFSQPLLSISSIGGMSWSFGLKYLSTAPTDEMVGKGFNFPQNLHLEEQADSDVDLISGDNTSETFDESGGNYTPASNNSSQATLDRDGIGVNDEFTMTSNDGTVTKFFGFDSAIDTPGRLKSITDRYGNQQTYTWQRVGGVDQLASVTDSYGRTMTYRYWGSEYGDRLKEIEDFLGRKLNFQYDSLGHLVAVVTPSITRAADGNTFPGGTAYVFQYDINNARSERRDDLIRIWYPNQATPFIDTDSRTVDVDAVYAGAAPRYFVEYGQDPTDELHWGRVVRETIGDADDGVGGTYEYFYTQDGLPTNIIDASDPIVQRTVVTDRNGNQRTYDFTFAGMPARTEVIRSRDKIDVPSLSTYPGYVTWTKYNSRNQPLEVVMPEGNSIEYEYEDGSVSGITGTYNKRQGLLLRQTRKPGNTIGVTSRSGSSGQEELTQRFFYDPIFNQQTAVIEERGNPITGSTYFTPQNGGTTPTNTDRSRYATFTFCDYQQNTDAVIIADTTLQTLLGLTSGEIQSLLNHVNTQMINGGLPASGSPSLSFKRDLGDINGDGTGNGASSTLPVARMVGDVVKIQHPEVRLIGSSSITQQVREEIFTHNDRGQVTTHTNPEGNLTVTLRYPDNDPEGDGQFIATGLSSKQYGRVKEVRVDADPDDVMSLIGADGDLTDFVSGKITRTNTPGEYQNLITRFEGSKIGAGGGCAACAYDPLGNPLAETDARGFTTRFDRNELGEAFRVTSPDPYRYQVETHFDANRNVVRVDTQDRFVQFVSDDPGDACYAQMNPSGSGFVAQVATQDGVGGALRPGWFTDLMSYDLLDNLVEEDRDATGSDPDRLVTTHDYDANQNLIKTTKPEGNTVEYDYEERDLRIAVRVGDSPDTPAITVTAYDANGNLIQSIGPAERGGSGNHGTITIEDPFRETGTLVHTGDFTLENTYDGFDRAIEAKDAAGNVVDTNGTLLDPCYDPGGRLIKSTTQGPISGTTPTDRNGTNNQDLSEGSMRFDEAGRTYESQQQVFVAAMTMLNSLRSVDHVGGGLETNSTANSHTGTTALVTAGVATSMSSYVLSRTVHDRAGRVVESIADNAESSTVVYDGANRQIQTTDAVGNVTDLEYDGNGNVIQATATETCTITSPTVDDEVFRSATRYDSLNRPVVSAMQGADGSFDLELLACDSDAVWQVAASTLFSLIGYDSRGNQTLSIDPKGNSTITIYDGVSRPTQLQEQLRVDGQGAAAPAAGQTFLPFSDGAVVTQTDYDGNGRVTRLVDDNGNQTLYQYDSLDRETQMEFMDGSTRDYVYNKASNVTQYTDENGSVLDNTYDPLGRKTQCDVTQATGVIGTTQQKFEYDGLSRLTFCRDTVSASSADVNLQYDSLSRVLEDSQVFGGNTRNATNEEFTSFPVTQAAFPDGRQISHVYDELYRRTLVEETSGGADIAVWEYFGPGRVAEVTLGNGLICSHLNNARTHSAVQESVSNPAWGDDASDRLGYDGVGRMITKRYLSGGINGTTHAYNDATAVVGQTTAYDKASNKLYERALHAESRSSLYEPFDSDNRPQGGHDSLNRLRQYQRGVLASTGGSGNAGGGSISTAISLSGTDESRDYDLDGLGNWRRTTFDPVGGSETTQVRQHNSLNQLTRLDSDDLAYDANGNLTEDDLRKYEWDAFNRLKQVSKTPSSPVVIGEYHYDALGRRMQKVVTNGGLSGTIPNGTTDYLYHSGGSQCCEERDNLNSVTKQYVWGGYIDELLQMKTAVTINGNAAGDYYPLSDTLYRTQALTNSSGTLVETYDTDAYGNTLIFTAAGTGSDWWADDATQGDNPTCEFIFTGRRYDSESEIYFYRSRYYVPELGRFISRDPIEYVDGLSLYGAYFIAQGLDPFGISKLLGYVYLFKDPNNVYVGSTGDLAGRGFNTTKHPKLKDLIDKPGATLQVRNVYGNATKTGDVKHALEAAESKLYHEMGLKVGGRWKGRKVLNGQTPLNTTDMRKYYQQFGVSRGRKWFTFSNSGGTTISAQLGHINRGARLSTKLLKGAGIVAPVIFATWGYDVMVAEGQEIGEKLVKHIGRCQLFQLLFQSPPNEEQTKIRMFDGGKLLSARVVPLNSGIGRCHCWIVVEEFDVDPESGKLTDSNFVVEEYKCPARFRNPSKDCIK